MFKRKKHNYPGLYGKFQKINLSYKESAEPQDKAEQKNTPSIKNLDFSHDEDLASLDQLIKRIKHKGKGETAVTRDEHSEDDQLDDLKKHPSELGSNAAARPENTAAQVSEYEISDSDDSRYAAVFTNSSFIEGLEKDLFQKNPAAASSSGVKQIETTLLEILERIAKLPPAERAAVVYGSVMRNFLKTCSGDKDVTDDR